ncbi:MAG: hypothetical protein HKP42_02625 [Maribacter sp.]|nr:hypothetical protein [Maribacter sp.]MBT8301072.1 hypothetical protein [Maribacter sp.]NNK74935.1 hypothetical protein [Maribacter sp.]
MENKTIQDKLSFFAMAGAKDVVFENRRVSNRRRKTSTPIIVEKRRFNDGLLSKNAIQLSLF